MKYSHLYPKSHENKDRFPLKRNHHGRPFLLCSVNYYPFFHPSSLSNETPKWVSLQKPHFKLGLHQNPSKSRISKAKLEWTEENPLAKRIRLWWWWFGTLNQMPKNDYVFNDDKSLPRVLLFEPGGSSAEILLYGGKVVSWKNSHGEELLFMSRNAGGRSPKGGISICFPQVSNTGMTKEICWSKKNAKSFDNIPLRLTPTGNPSSVDLTLKTTANDSNTWPHRTRHDITSCTALDWYRDSNVNETKIAIFGPTQKGGHSRLLRRQEIENGSLSHLFGFELRLRVSLGPDKMTIISHIKNTDNTSFSFTLALQNYLSVSDISEVRVEGLETLDFLDNLQQGKRFTEQPDAITFDGQVDRVYTRTPGNIAIIDHNKKRTIVIRNEGLPDTGLWTPWDNATKASRLGFGDKDYKTMLSVDSSVLEKPVTLKPSEEWKGYQELSIISSSYCSGQLDPKTVAYYAKV